MLVRQENSRPYAATSNVISFLNRARTRNLPERISPEFLRISGVPEIVFGRVLQALKFLGLTDDRGSPTEQLHSLATAPEAEYRDRLAAVLRSAYRREFEVIDPSQDPQSRIVDAFRPYEPRSQTSRMVMLFLGLCREAGIQVLEGSKESKRVGRKKKNSEASSLATQSKIRPNYVPDASESHQFRDPSGTLLFQLTEDDIGLLDEETFQDLWSALGKIARARAKAKSHSDEQTENQQEEEASDVRSSNITTRSLTLFEGR